MLCNVLSISYSNAWTRYGVFNMRHYTTVLHSSDFRLSEYQRYVCVCLCVCVSVLPGCFIIQSKRAQTQTDEWGRILPLSLFS